MVGEMLDELGYEHRRVSSAAAALETLGTDRAFDLVFSDMVMPGSLGGLDLAREIARLRPVLPVVLTTGYSAAAAAAMAEGFELLTKPYSIQSLAATLRNVPERRTLIGSRFPAVARELGQLHRSTAIAR